MGSLQGQNGGLTGPEWGSHRARMGFLQAQNGVLTGPEYSSYRRRMGFLPAENVILSGSKWGSLKAKAGFLQAQNGVPPCPVPPIETPPRCAVNERRPRVLEGSVYCLAQPSLMPSVTATVTPRYQGYGVWARPAAGTDAGVSCRFRVAKMNNINPIVGNCNRRQFGLPHCTVSYPCNVECQAR